MHAPAARAMGAHAAACMGTTLLFLQLLAAPHSTNAAAEYVRVSGDGTCLDDIGKNPPSCQSPTQNQPSDTSGCRAACDLLGPACAAWAHWENYQGGTFNTGAGKPSTYGKVAYCWVFGTRIRAAAEDTYVNEWECQVGDGTSDVVTQTNKRAGVSCFARKG